MERRPQSDIAFQCDVCFAQVQTDLIMDELVSLKIDYRLRLKEMQQLKAEANQKCHPTQEKLAKDTKLLAFYTGLKSSAVFLATFNFISSVIPQHLNN